MSYKEQLEKLENPTFNAIKSIAKSIILKLSNSKRDELWKQLNRGTAILSSQEQMCQYLYSYGDMHQAKLLDAFNYLPGELFTNSIEIVDWGCGQGIGSMVFLDFLNQKKLNNKVKRITLIEPGTKALAQAKSHLEVYAKGDYPINALAKYFNTISADEIKTNSGNTIIHIFSNILDVAQIDLKQLAILVDGAVTTSNYLVCVGPLNPTNRRIDAFYNYFDRNKISNQYEFENTDLNNRGWTYKARIYRLDPNEQGHLIPIEYYPTVQFHAAYSLDFIRALVIKNKSDVFNELNYFEVAAPFDLGASIYDDVHPILAVLNNIICRGLPTKASPFIEDIFQQAFNLSDREINLGEITYPLKQGASYEFFNYRKYFDHINGIDEKDKVAIELLLTPIAVARFQKVLLEAIITGQLDIQKSHWKILIEEKDVPFGHIAIEDFRNIFDHLTQLSVDYKEFNLPEIELFVVSNENFGTSKLQTGRVYSKTDEKLKTIQYDMVLTHAILKSTSAEIEAFSEYRVQNNCYFNIRSSNLLRSQRVIYTSDPVKYSNVVSKNRQGVFLEIEETQQHLHYFLQLLFRKERFRPGQLPILDRALQNLPVIGLLPTGAGKSLTYQLAAMLQPGITLIVDPLKSLMKDQYDGLVRNGIDTGTFINSTLTKSERQKRERQLESSQLQFIFLSPERLAIASFRERLKNMHEYNVYFSFGVIDEVHCVSEWGHDFRFSYLHLGRNLYNYVKAKNNEIALFGLTATASFDVLADVERELSGNGAFVLDADVIVRYENTNRLELQYRIVKVQAEFEEDIFYDQNKKIASHLPRAINITNHWKVFDSKAEFLKKYVSTLPQYLNSIQEEKNIGRIKSRYTERQNIIEGVEADLTVTIEDNFKEKRNEYTNAGIVFCTHVDKSGISVAVNKSNLKGEGFAEVSSFSGRDDDETSMENLELFRNNKSPLMVATKAFGMGIDKPNVRFTVNMNYSSSLESFVQEAGRAGRDRKIALSSILVSDYSLVQISRKYENNAFPLLIIRNKWFHEKDLKKILDHYRLSIPKEYIIRANPANDIVKLHCAKDNKMFAFNKCDNTCSEFNGCRLKRANSDTRGWKSENELIQELRAQNINISKKNFQYLNPDYQTVMYFFNEAFKGDFVEKVFINQLLNITDVQVENDEISISKIGFLTTLKSIKNEQTIVIYVPYNSGNNADLSKAIYRMTCIELIEDFTQDYANNQFRIVARKKSSGGYYEGLKNFLLRYYTAERADLELEKAKIKKIYKENIDSFETEIYKCLSYLTEFVYDKISEKRKRAIDDMRNFCMEGLADNVTWLEANENLKDFIFYYFNSKYAKTDYVADNGESYSLLNDTDGGKISNESILLKYLKVINEEVIGIGTPLDNVKHLYGAVRLISRSLTESNPTLYLLEAFCLAYMGIKGNKNLEEQLMARYSEGILEFYDRPLETKDFDTLYMNFNKTIEPYMTKKEFNTLLEETFFLITIAKFRTVKNKYLSIHE